jgi:hypothetical protein
LNYELQQKKIYANESKTDNPFYVINGIFIFKFLAELLVGFGDLKPQVVAGKPAGFSDLSLPGRKYPASPATVSIYKPNVDFYP